MPPKNVREFVVEITPDHAATVELHDLMNVEDLACLKALAKDKDLSINLGAFTGASAEAILEGSNGVCVSVDTFEGTPQDFLTVVPPMIVWGCYRTRLKRFGTRVRTLIGDSLEVAAMLQPEIADLVFIDAAHTYSAAKADILAWSRIAKPGAIIAGHDYIGALRYMPTDWVEANKERVLPNFHPGVFLAVNELLPGAVISDDPNCSVWWARKP